MHNVILYRYLRCVKMYQNIFSSNSGSSPSYWLSALSGTYNWAESCT